MKATLVLMTMLTFSTGAFAQTSANAVEKNLLCNAVDKLLEVELADMALDLKDCLKKKTITSGIIFPEQKIRLKGNLVFRAPNRPNFSMTCQLEYVGTPEFKNVIGGLESGVECWSE